MFFCTQKYYRKRVSNSETMFKPILLLLCLVAVTVRQAMAMKICTMQPDYNSGDGKIKTYQGKIVKQFDEADTPAMQGNDCVELWCRAQCENERKCKKFAYLAILGGKTTCTLYSSAKIKNVACPRNKCDSEYGKCRG